MRRATQSNLESVVRSRPLSWFIVVLLLLLVGSPALAFDGNRKGFILGIGVGPSATSFKQKLSGGFIGESKRETKAGVGTDFKLGYSPSGQLVILYDNRVAWFKLTNGLNKSVTIASGASNAAVLYYMQPQFPSPFVTGGIGISAWSTPFESGSSGSTGFGIFGGAGYEFAKHWSVEGTVNYGNPSDEQGGVKLTTNAISFHATVNLLGY